MCIRDSLEGVVVGGDARSAGPGEVERFQLFAELNGADLLNVEGVIVEEKLLDLREVLLGPLELGRHIICRPLAPCVTAEGLRPEAEGALRGAAARGVERDVRVKQERDVVTCDVHVALVDFGGPGPVSYTHLDVYKRQDHYSEEHQVLIGFETVGHVCSGQ